MAITHKTIDLSGMNNKVENQGATAQGRMTATEMNTLVNGTIEAQNNITALDEYASNSERFLSGKLKTSTAAGVCIFTESTKSNQTSSFVIEEQATGAGFYETAVISLPAGKTILFQDASSGTDGYFFIKYYDSDWGDYILTENEYFTNESSSAINVYIFRSLTATAPSAYQPNESLNPGTITYRIGTLVSSQIGNINAILTAINGNS